METTTQNPWQRLASRAPSIFSTDPHFTPKKSTAPSVAKSIGIGALSKKGHEVAMRRQSTDCTGHSKPLRPGR